MCGLGCYGLWRGRVRVGTWRDVAGGGVLDTVSLSGCRGFRESRGHRRPNVTGCHFHDIP